MSDITLASPPTTLETTASILSTMAAESGVVTDYNVGSQIRTQTESIGAVIEQQSVWTQALAFQALVYCALGLFGITPGVGTAASGVVQFTTSQIVSGGPPSPVNVSIPSGTIIQTTGGILAQTLNNTTLLAGSSGVSVLAQALTSGSAGNVGASGFINIVTPPAAPLFVNNPLPFTGGNDPTTPSQSLAVFAAEISSIGLSSPLAIANAAIGVTASGATVKFSTVYEPWAVSGSASSGQAYYELIIDDGTGNASSGLITAVKAKLNGGMVSGATNNGTIVGYRDAGVPYDVFAVIPTIAMVSISGTVSSLSQVGTVSGAIASAVSSYFSLPFGAPAEQPQISASVVNSAQGSLTSIAVELTASGSTTSLDALTPPSSGRVILGGLSLSISAASTS